MHALPPWRPREPDFRKRNSKRLRRWPRPRPTARRRPAGLPSASRESPVRYRIGQACARRAVNTATRLGSNQSSQLLVHPAGALHACTRSSCGWTAIPNRPLTRARCSLRLPRSRGTRRASFTMRAWTWSTRASCPCGTPPPFTWWSRRLCSRSRSSRSRSRTSTGRGSSARPTFRTMGSTARPLSRCSTHTHTRARAHATVRIKPPLFLHSRASGAGVPPPTRRDSSRPKRPRATPTPRAPTRPLRDAC